MKDTKGSDRSSALFLELTKGLRFQKKQNVTPKSDVIAGSDVMQKRDLIACAPTGSGKTLAFLLPILTLLKRHLKSGGFRALVLVPTRELVEQIFRDISLLSLRKPFNVCTLNSSMVNSFKATPPTSFDILLSTPLLLSQALKDKCIDLSALQIAILDEADKLLEEGLLEQTDAILQFIPKEVIKALFTATLPSTAEAMAYTFLKNDPVRLFVGQHYAATELIDQKLVFVGEESGKLLAVKQLLHGDYKSFSEDQSFCGLKPPILIFVESIKIAELLYQELCSLPVSVIHGEKSHAERSRIIHEFRLGKIWILITTELLSRGIDFKGVNGVLNYDFPDTAASYIHRIGRTGRAGRKGTAVTLFSLDDVDKLRSVANVMKMSGCAVPDYMLQLRKAKKKEIIMKKKLKYSQEQKKMRRSQGYIQRAPQAIRSDDNEHSEKLLEEP